MAVMPVDAVVMAAVAELARSPQRRPPPSPKHAEVA